MEHEGTAGADGPQMSEALQRQLDAVLGPGDQALTPPPTPEARPLAEAEAKAQDYLGLLQRTQADFQNYRKRVDQERGELREQLRGDTLARLLPVLDDLTRALQELPPDLGDHPWAQGIVLVQRKLLALLEAEGLTRIEAQGQPFDPRQHEAVHYEESDNHAEGSVLAVFRDGYRLGGRVLRPAQVIVARAAPARGPTPLSDPRGEAGPLEPKSDAQAT